MTLWPQRRLSSPLLVSVLGPHAYQISAMGVRLETLFARAEDKMEIAMAKWGCVSM